VGGRPLNSALDVMRKFIAALSLLTFAGCATEPFALSQSTDFAALTMISGRSPSPFEHGGFTAIGTYAVRPVSSKIFVKPGHRKIWYTCPGFISTDAGPSIEFTFERNGVYELTCRPGAGQPPAIRRVDV
jgi:hypothetical protein